MHHLDKLNRFLGLKRGLLVALLASTSLSFGVTAALANPTIIAVDLNAQTLKLGAGTDDLATLQNLFQSANMPSERVVPASPLAQVMLDLKMKRMRFLF